AESDYYEEWSARTTVDPDSEVPSTCLVIRLKDLYPDSPPTYCSAALVRTFHTRNPPTCVAVRSMTKRKTDLEWLGDHLGILTEAGERVRSIEHTVYNDFNAWTTLKLIGVKFWQRIYTDIIQEHLELLRKECMAYLDVMAGSGLNRIRDADCYVAGSSILAALVPRKPFHYI